MLSLLLAAVLALPASSAVAQVPAAQQAPVAAAPDAAALQKEYDALVAEYSKADEAFWASLPRDASGDISVTEEQMAKRPDNVFGPRFLEFGRRAGKTEAGCKAWVEALRMVHEPPATRDEIIRQLVEGFADSPSLARAVPHFGGLRWTKGSAEAEALLRRVLAETSVDDVKAAATLELAQVLMDSVYEPGGTEPKPREDVAPARALLSELVERWPDTQYAQEAKGSLFEIDHLQVGMVAPDVESTDQDGQGFKLSDYRGKVVLLDFWGFW